VERRFLRIHGLPLAMATGENIGEYSFVDAAGRRDFGNHDAVDDSDVAVDSHVHFFEVFGSLGRRILPVAQIIELIGFGYKADGQSMNEIVSKNVLENIGIVLGGEPTIFETEQSLLGFIVALQALVGGDC
jgi:hypothetical protein